MKTEKEVNVYVSRVQVGPRHASAINKERDLYE